MSCSCGCSPCSCSPNPTVCCTPTTESVEYTFENANLVGIGVFDNDTDNLVQFRGIVSNSASLTVTLNATDNTIEIDFDDAALVLDIPDATTSQRGILETATDAEAIAKAAVDKILTPSNLAALDASTSFQGLVELATDAETIAGVSTTLAVTPAGLAAAAALYSTLTWADAVTRAGDTPGFDGQIGVQLDTNVPYVANGAAVGDFDVPVLVGSGTNTLAAATTIANAGFNITYSGTGGVLISVSGNFTVSSNVLFTGNMQFGSGGVETINFEGGVFQINGGTLNTELLGADVTGNVTAFAVANFLSNYDTQTGYTAFTNGAVLRTCDTTTVTLPQLAQIVGTLIEDLKAIQLPAA